MYRVLREVDDGGRTLTTHPIGRSFENRGDAISFASFAATDNMMSQNFSDMKNLPNGFCLYMTSGMTISYVVKEFSDVGGEIMPPTKLQAAVDDLQKVLDGFKAASPENWHAIWNANGDFTVVPVLVALIHGYSELAKLEER